MIKIDHATQLITKQSKKTIQKQILSDAKNNFDLQYAYNKLPTDILEIKKEQIETFIKQKLSMDQIAKKLNIKLSQLRTLLNDLNLATERQKEYRLLKSYFDASTGVEKAEIMQEIDEYLKQIAKEKSKVEGEPFEDCLQDIRLQFFEIISQAKENGNTYKTAIFDRLKKSIQPKEKIETVPLSTLKKTNSRPVSEDINIQQFEADNLESHLWLYMKQYLNDRDLFILNEYVNENKSPKEISKILQLPLERTITLYDRAIKRAVFRISRFCEKLEGLNIIKKINSL